MVESNPVCVRMRTSLYALTAMSTGWAYRFGCPRQGGAARSASRFLERCSRLNVARLRTVCDAARRPSFISHGEASLQAWTALAPSGVRTAPPCGGPAVHRKRPACSLLAPHPISNCPARPLRPRASLVAPRIVPTPRRRELAVRRRGPRPRARETLAIRRAGPPTPQGVPPPPPRPAAPPPCGLPAAPR